MDTGPALEAAKAIYIFVFFFGAVVGSFLNVVIARYNTAMTFLGRSFCFSCGKTLTWKELFPIISFFVLSRRCRLCKSKISWQYPAVEFLTALVFILSFWKVGGAGIFFLDPLSFKLALGQLLYVWTAFSLLIVITVYDVKQKIIPDGFVYTFAALAFGKLAFDYALFPGIIPPNSLDFLAGPLLAAPFAALWFVSAGRWIGLGDAKLTLGLGWFLGFWRGVQALLFAFWIGALAGIILIGFSALYKKYGSKRWTMKSEMPFAPFLVLGLFLVYLSGFSFFS